jgi:hypothetical protein
VTGRNEEYAMNYIRHSTYDVVNGTFGELTETAEKGILPMFEAEGGFVNYGLVDLGNHKVAAISIWATREAAQNSASMAATWVKENVSNRVRLINTTIGELALFRGAPVAA